MLNNESLIIKLDTDTKEKVSIQVEGDCCSQSWIEHNTIPDDINGATILGVDDIGMDTPKDLDLSQYECLACYECRIKTTAGDIVLEYRNNSNGYYGGYTIWGIQ